MGPSPILSIIHSITIDTMLNKNSSNYGHERKNDMCKTTSTCAEPDETNTFDTALRGYVYNM